MQEKQPWIKWDGSLNPSTLISGGAIVVTIIVGITQMAARVDSLSVSQDRFGERIDKRLATLEAGMIDLRLATAQNDGVRRAVADHETRLRSVEARIR